MISAVTCLECDGKGKELSIGDREVPCVYCSGVGELRSVIVPEAIEGVTKNFRGGHQIWFEDQSGRWRPVCGTSGRGFGGKLMPGAKPPAVSKKRTLTFCQALILLFRRLGQ